MGLAGAQGWVRGRALGRGSTATVYLAARPTPDGLVEKFAVKSAELSRSADLEREKRTLSSLRSPHVVSFLGSDVTAESDGRVLYNLFMEYVPGGTLSEAIKRQGALVERSVRLYTRGILRGLAYLHSMGVAHCDVKGQNILVGDDSAHCVKLADLGCARWVAGDGDGGAIGGTPLYMAPEVARGEEQGTAADIWALGCTVIEMATGRPPWTDVAEPVATIHRIAFSDDVPEFPCKISEDARDFLGRCLKRDPRVRWSAEQLLNHPFVHGTEEFSSVRTPEYSKKTSPRSTLDHAFWNWWAEEEGEEEEEECARPLGEGWPLEAARIHLLTGSSISLSPAAGVTWQDSCWITVRSEAEAGHNTNNNHAGSFMSPSAVSSEDDLIPTGAERMSAGTSRWAGSTAGGLWYQKSLGCSDRCVDTVEACPPSNCNYDYFTSDDDRINSCTVLVVDERDYSVHSSICCSHIYKQGNLPINYYYDTLPDPNDRLSL